jgi:uncharacterized repeat protein (TIGR03803 family)
LKLSPFDPLRLLEAQASSRPKTETNECPMQNEISKIIQNLRVWLRLLWFSLAFTALSVLAMTPTVIHSFTKSISPFNLSGTNVDGAFPETGLVESGGVLYGVAAGGGQFGFGTIFKLGTNGSGFSTLKSFNSIDGALPVTKLALSATTLYGATPSSSGGAVAGTLFKIQTDGSGFTILRRLTNGVDGQGVATLVVSGSTLYGVEVGGGLSGTLFKVNTDGTGFSVLHSFRGRSEADGAVPTLLTLVGNQLFGTTSRGGINDDGTIFRIDTNGSGYAVLKSFFEPVDGGMPVALIPSGGTLVGLAATGGSQGHGTIFRMNSDGTGFTVITNFPGGTNGIALLPFPGFALQDNTFYGATVNGGNNPSTLFKVNTDGSGLATLATFTNELAVAIPLGGVIAVGNELYGTTYTGGMHGNGCVYKLALSAGNYAPSQVSIQPPGISGGNFILRFQTVSNQSYTVEQSTQVSGGSWTAVTNFTGNGSAFQMAVPMAGKFSLFFRVR